MQTTNKPSAQGMSKSAKTGVIVALIAAIGGAVAWTVLRSDSSTTVIKPTPEATTRTNMERIVERIRPMLDESKMPTSAEELPPVAGAAAPAPGEPTVNQDGWGHAITIKGKRDGSNVKITVHSSGVDGQASTADDWLLEAEYVVVNGKSVVSGMSMKSSGGG